MQFETKKRYKSLLEARREALQTGSETNADSRKTVALDQQSVGRLSRMDALQQQAMAQATQARREAELAHIFAALNRLNEDSEYGCCDKCGEPISEARLLLTPVALSVLIATSDIF